MIILDISKPFQLKPGFLKSKIGYKKNYRAWWLWFAITFCNMSDYKYYQIISSGATEWIKSNNQEPKK